MVLTPMRFKDYTWPHNPTTYAVTWRRAVAGGKIPFGESWMQDLGLRWREMTGEGEFAGEGAYEAFLTLAEVFAREGSGLLAHPLWPAVEAYFVELEAVEEPLPDYVRYRFTFWENASATDGALRELPPETGTLQTVPVGTVYTVVQGDTLWGISRRYGVLLYDLVKANPQIKNPNLIYPGDKVVIP